MGSLGSLVIGKDCKFTRVMNAVAAGTTAQNSSSVDMTGFDGVCFVAAVGTLTSTAVTSMHAAQSSDDSTFTDLEGTSISFADDDDNQIAVLDVVNPVDRYVRCEISRGTANAVIDGVIAIQYRSQKSPVTHDATTVVGSESHLSPAEGTA